jgi:alanyl-tRNA synthetase
LCDLPELYEFIKFEVPHMTMLTALTTKDYLFDPKLTASAIITAIGQDNGQSWVQLDRTIFHPQGGGQKADRGSIQDIPVSQVVHSDGSVNHYLESTEDLQIGQLVSLYVDSDWRLANSQLHTAGHLIAALLEKRFPNLTPVSAHHWPGESRVEFTGDNLPTPEVIETHLTAALQKAIQDDLSLAVLGSSTTVRSIQIGTFGAVPCGGTHLQNLGQLNNVNLTGVKIKKGKLRISYEVS